MNPWAGWLLIAIGAVAGWHAYGWQGLVFVGTSADPGFFAFVA